MALTPTQLYRVHVENLRAVRIGLDRIERELRSAISRRDTESSSALLKILLLLMGSWAECRLRKLIYEQNGFDEDHRSYIEGGRSQLEKWNRAVEMGFRLRYGFPRANLNNSLRVTPRLHFRTLNDTIDSDLKPIIEIRNTLAHGQWAKPLNSRHTNLSPTMIAAIRRENALSARFKLTMIECLALAVHDLIAGNHAFERDFDYHYMRLENARTSLQTRNYEDWRQSMIAKFDSGRVKRNSALLAMGAAAGGENQ